MRPPLVNPTFTPTKWAVALLILVIWTTLLLRCSAATVVFGNPPTNFITPLPLGTNGNGTAAYVGRYQQIYASSVYAGSVFPSQSLISQIAFASYAGTVTDPRNVTYMLSIGLGITSRTPANPGSGFSSEATPLFSGPFVAHVTPGAGDWDIVIDLPTPFLYDSSLGSLLLDVTVNSISGPPSMSTNWIVRQSPKTMAEIHDTGKGVTAFSGSGLATQFTVIPVPEPATAGMLLLGAVLCIRRRVRGKGAIVLAGIWGALIFPSHAATVVAGAMQSGNDRPFGFQKGVTAVYPGQYQQIYRKGLFPTATQITQIAFAEEQGLGDADVTYTLSIGLGVTARTPLSPGTGFGTGATTVFNGTAAAHITAASGDFDFTITLDTPFLYDPALGNLLLDITVVSATKPIQGKTYGYFAYATSTNDIARIYNGSTGVVAQGARGLVTRFTVNPVPEPATPGMLLLGVVMCVRRRGRGKVALLIAASLGIFLCDNSRAATVIAGTGRTVQPTIFSTYGVTYVGEYQQIYDRHLFSKPGVITQIGFRYIDSYDGYNTDVIYNLSVGLGVTERTPSSPGSGFATGATTVFSGLLPVHITSSNLDFDLLIPLTTPFLYDPALGNLLLDITLFSAGQTPPNLPVYTFSYDNAASDIATIRPGRAAGTVIVLPNEGIVTQFTIVPEPATGALLLLGAALGMSRRVRAPLLRPEPAQER